MPRKLNPQNIEPYKFQSGEKAREAGRKGGIKSGEVKRLKSSMREVMREIVYGKMPVNYENEEIVKLAKLWGISPDNPAVLIGLSVVRESITGKLDAIRLLHELLGEKQAEVQIHNSTTMGVDNMSLDELKSMHAKLLAEYGARKSGNNRKRKP